MPRAALVPKDGRVESPLYGETVAVCDKCVGDLLYCDVHDAYLCPVCDRWQEAACADPDCPYCPSRPERPTLCAHSDRHRRAGS